MFRKLSSLHGLFEAFQQTRTTITYKRTLYYFRNHKGFTFMISKAIIMNSDRVRRSINKFSSNECHFCNRYRFFTHRGTFASVQDRKPGALASDFHISVKNSNFLLDEGRQSIQMRYVIFRKVIKKVIDLLKRINKQTFL